MKPAEVYFPDANHFVAISVDDGLDTSQSEIKMKLDTTKVHVWIEDPELGPGNEVEFAYEDFIQNYRYLNSPDSDSGVVVDFQRTSKARLS